MSEDIETRRRDSGQTRQGRGHARTCLLRCTKWRKPEQLLHCFHCSKLSDFLRFQSTNTQKSIFSFQNTHHCHWQQWTMSLILWGGSLPTVPGRWPNVTPFLRARLIPWVLAQDQPVGLQTVNQPLAGLQFMLPIHLLMVKKEKKREHQHNRSVCPPSLTLVCDTQIRGLSAEVLPGPCERILTISCDHLK